MISGDLNGHTGKLANGLSDCNWTRNHNHLVREQTLKHLASLAK